MSFGGRHQVGQTCPAQQVGQVGQPGQIQLVPPFADTGGTGGTNRPPLKGGAQSCPSDPAHRAAVPATLEHR